MVFLSNLSFKWKISLISIIGVIGFICYLLFNYVSNIENESRLLKIKNQYYPMLEKVDINIAGLSTIKELFKTAVIAEDEDFLNDAELLSQGTHQIFTELSELDDSSAQRVSQLSELFSQYYNAAYKLSSGMVDGALAGAQISTLSEKMNLSLKHYNDEIEAFRQQHYENFLSAIGASVSASERNIVIGFIIALVVLLGSMIVTIAIITMVSRQIGATSHAFKQMANGDLSVQLAVTGDDEFGKLNKYFNASINQFRGIIQELFTTSESLLSLSGSLNNSTNESVSDILRQKKDIKLMVQSLNELSSSINVVASSAGDAASASESASHDSRLGEEIVEETMSVINNLALEVDSANTAVNSLCESSDNIGKVLTVIGEIAEQTNLLALNAAIEAARAGDQGRGFAVVADEVRTLAGRTQDATKEIQTMIQQLQSSADIAKSGMKKGQDGTQLGVVQAQKTGDSLKSIASAISIILDLSAQIATSTEQQSAVAEDINVKIKSISEVSEHTAIAADLSVKTADEVLTAAQTTNAIAHRFTL